MIRFTFFGIYADYIPICIRKGSCRCIFDFNWHSSSYFTHTVRQRFDSCICQQMIFPVDGYFKTTSCFQTFYLPFFPRIGQCSKQVYLAKMALQKHFCNACGATEISINLKRGMRIKEIGIRAAAFGIIKSCFTCCL